mmetsp:Transcript_22430/g.51056  ORF Transcript_22430/g.51056 Transcript_22430/m.51056 type:complete len:98 (+) Transcript_22430:99-392(+)
MAQVRVLKGIVNSMPMVMSPGQQPAPRDYVILGSHAAWTKEPAAIVFSDGARAPVAKETFDWMCRGIALPAGDSVAATVELSDGTTEDVQIEIQRVC